jgi:hypothetical protein
VQWNDRLFYISIDAIESLWYGVVARPNQTINKQRTIVQFSCQEREQKKTQTIDHQRQSNHDMSTIAVPCERGHVCASSYMADDQIWLPGSVSHTSLIAWVPPTRWGVWNTCQ